MMEQAERNSIFIENLTSHEHALSDAELSRLLSVNSSVISNIRTGKVLVGNSIVVKILKLNPDWNLFAVNNLWSKK